MYSACLLLYIDAFSSLSSRIDINNSF